MTLLSRGLALGVGVVLTAGLVLGSALPYTDAPDAAALIRLSWRAVGERVEECRAPSPDELAALPPHMRQSEICEARLAPFRLAVAIDGATVFEGRIRPRGARRDRPAYVFQEFRVAPGSHRLGIEFASEAGGEPGRPPLRFDERVTLDARDILLVTTPPEADRLIALGGSR